MGKPPGQSQQRKALVLAVGIALVTALIVLILMRLMPGLSVPSAPMSLAQRLVAVPVFIASFGVLLWSCVLAVREGQFQPSRTAPLSRGERQLVSKQVIIMTFGVVNLRRNRKRLKTFLIAHRPPGPAVDQGMGRKGPLS
jgi:hypothetical protein